MMDWQEVAGALSEKLDPANVKKPNGKFGPKGDYIEGWHAIAEANRIFGFGGWSYEIKGLTKDACTEGKDSNGNPQWQAAYTCLIRVTVDDVVREDVGFGSGFAKNIGDAVEGATKEAVTDALKRALRTFGNPFGLALYDKSRENVGSNEPPFNSEAASIRIMKRIEKATTQEHLDDIRKEEKGTLDALTDGDFAQVKEHFQRAKNTLINDPARQAPQPDDLEEFI